MWSGVIPLQNLDGVVLSSQIPKPNTILISLPIFDFLSSIIEAKNDKKPETYAPYFDQLTSVSIKLSVRGDQKNAITMVNIKHCSHALPASWANRTQSSRMNAMHRKKSQDSTGTHTDTDESIARYLLPGGSLVTINNLIPN
jgi:hypothetical protein